MEPASLDPTRPLADLPGLSAARAKSLERLGLATIGDLLGHYPRRYEDRRQFAHFPTTADDKPVCLCGVVISTASKRFRGRQTMFEAVLQEPSGHALSSRLTLRWFNAWFVQKLLAAGQRVVVYGKPKQSGPRLLIDHPDFETLEGTDDTADPEALVHLRRITPVYPATEGLSQRALRGLIHQTLQLVDLAAIESALPATLDKMPRGDALRAIHFPADDAELARARQHLVLTEFFALQMLIAARRTRMIQRAGESHCGPGKLLDRFHDSLSFGLTKAQWRSLGEIRNDLAAERPMNRLLQGDVGSGKTLVALSAMLLAVEAGYQAVLMAPTQVLAEQHWLVVRRWLEPLGLRLALRTGSRKEESAAEDDLFTVAKPRPRSAAGVKSDPVAVKSGVDLLLFATEAVNSDATATTSGQEAVREEAVNTTSVAKGVKSEPKGVESEPDEVMSEANGVTFGPDKVKFGPNRVMSEANGVTFGPNGVTSGPDGVTSSPDGTTATRILIASTSVNPGSRADGLPDIIIGTHALLFEKDLAPRLGLVVIDEQHKFGVLQRAKLSAGRKTAPDVLVMTATPIPRTLAITIYGDLDVSILDELPAGRGKIVTAVRPAAKLTEAGEFIRKQLADGRQAYIVYPLIEESEKLNVKAATDGLAHWREVLQPFRCELLHGRMRPEEKDAVMRAFREGSVHALVSTTVIEVGIDVKNANVMLIENAERFGLAQLHQLRGRIGRGEHKSYCLLLTDPKAGEEALAKLRALEESSDGFVIAEADLKLRGAGDILGTAQSGLPPLKLGNLLADSDLMKLARNAAREIFEVDPGLRREENRRYKPFLVESRKLTLAQVS